jgi:tetratricopeptide (TPR) repeat protein
VTKQFSQLELFPLVGMETEHDPAAVAENDARIVKLWQEKPEKVPFDFWNGKTSRLSRATAKTFPLVHPQLWFSPTFPIGTLYDAAYRGESAFPRLDKQQLDQMKAAAPYNNRVLYHQMRTAQPRVATPEQLAAQFESVSGYDAWAMEVIANGSLADPDRYEAAFLPLCRLNPNQYLQLGRYLCEHQRFEAAARAYEKAIELAPDRVNVSNTVGWLVDYYYTHNRQTDAFRVAEMAAEAYSARGLRTMASLCERAGRLFDAESYFRKQAERYEDWEDLAIFYTRHFNEPKFTAAFERMITKIFPKGEEPADPTSMGGVPGDGVLLNTTSKTIESLGLQKGDVIVAINGIRIRNKGQYFYKMDTARSSKVDLIVWSKRSYRSVTADLPNHRLGVDIYNYQPPTTR